MEEGGGGGCGGGGCEGGAKAAERAKRAKLLVQDNYGIQEVSV